MKNKYRVAGYLRLSVEDGDKEISDSIVSQKNIIEEKIKQLGKNFELYDFYIDDGYTGLNTDRPNFQRMLDDIERKTINCVITKDLSRLSRNNFEANYLIEMYFLEKEIRYISILDNVDTYLKNSNNDMIQFKTLINDWYSKDISRKVKSGVWARKEKGLYVAAKAPYGYKKSEDNKNQLVVDEEESRIVKKIFQMYDKGETMGEIARVLSKDKIFCPSYNGFEKNKNGEYGWTYSTISKILKNKVYLGHIEYGKGINLSYKSKKVKQIPRAEWKIVFNTHKPIISQELFERVQNRINLNKKAKTHKHKWVLNGIVTCKECNEPMQLKVRYRKDGSISFMRLYCSSSLHKKGYCTRQYKGIELQSVTQIVISNLNKKVKHLINCDSVADLLEQDYKSRDMSGYEKELKISQRNLEKVNKIISSLYTDYKNGIIQEYDFKKMYDEETATRKRINEKIEKLNNKINDKTVISNNEFKRVVKKVSDVKKWSKEQLSDVIESVEIDNEDNIYINYRYNILELA
ncbi:MAG: recombinase family protein [Clostridia bacterium]|nr:recombinase family protein [Clostridia bacterium]MBP3596578.1 recombinase family protein [Clostridia bacterium]